MVDCGYALKCEVQITICHETRKLFTPESKREKQTHFSINISRQRPFYIKDIFSL